MPAGLYSFRDELVRNRVHRERDEYLARITETDIRNLASSHRHNAPCHLFREATRGSYNICYFVRFDDGTRWVVRIPLPPCLAFGAKDKLESEIATMQLVAERTNIPLPTIYAYKLGDGPSLFPSYLILEYVDGPKLSCFNIKTLPDEQRQRLLTSIADIYIQLRTIEFPAIGRLTREGGEFKVSKMPTSIDINMQELEGLAPSCTQTRYYSDCLLKSANLYIDMQLEVVYNAFLRSPTSVSHLESGRQALYHHHDFRRFVKEEWMKPDLDNGPFVLVHGDLEPHNLIVDEHMQVKAVLDWEWSSVLPLQHFLPPFWLEPVSTARLAWPFKYKAWLLSFQELRRIIKDREPCDTTLSREWDNASEHGGFLVANALASWTDVEWFAPRFIGETDYNGDHDIDKRVRDFMKEDPTREHLVTKLLELSADYQHEVERQSDPNQTTQTTDDVSPTTSWVNRLRAHVSQGLKQTTALSKPSFPFTAAAVTLAASLLLYRRVIRR